MPDQQTAPVVYRLEDLDVQEVSVVDRGANKRTFLVVKRDEEKHLAQARRMLADQKEANMPTHTEDDFEKAIADAQNGEVNPADNLTNTTDAGLPLEQADDPVVDAQAGKAEEDTHLAVEMNAEVRAQVGDLLAKMSDRMKALSEAVLAARDGDGDLPEKMKVEISEVMQALASVAQAGEPEEDDPEAVDPEEEKADGDEAEPAEPAEPAAQAPSGPDEMARPMALRYALKMMDRARAGLDEAHKLLVGPGDDGDDSDDDAAPSMDTSELRQAHNDAIRTGAGYMVEAMKAIGPFIPDAGGAPMQEEMTAAYAYNPPQASQPAGVPCAQMPGANLTKAGKKISGARLDKLEAMHMQLAALLGELRGASEVTEKVTKDNTAKEAEVARLATQVRQLAEIAKSQHAELHSFKSSRPDSNASVAGEFGQAVTPFSWPDDMNDKLDSDLQF